VTSALGSSAVLGRLANPGVMRMRGGVRVCEGRGSAVCEGLHDSTRPGVLFASPMCA
jgi:hypothetical protein